MALQKRTIVIVSIGILLLIIAGVLLFMFSVRTTEPIKREGFFGFIDSVNPFNGETPLFPIDDPNDIGTDTPGDTATSTLPRLRKIASGPIAGYTATTTKDGLSFRYIEKKTGHIYDGALTEQKTTRVTNSTIPRVQEAAINRNGVDLLFGYLGSDFNTFNTLAGTISDTEAYLSFSQISNEMSEFVASPTKNSFVAFSSDATGGRISVVTKQEKVIYRSPIKKWRGSWAGPTSLVVYPAATAAAPNAVYSLSEAGTLERIVGNRYGLEAVGWGDWYILSFVDPALQTILYNRKTEVWSSLSIITLAEKCVFVPNNNQALAYCAVPQSLPNTTYPDGWHEGRVSFEDSLWVIDASASDLDQLVTLPESVDAINLQLSADQNYLGFVNRRDGSLWALRLSEN